MKKIISLALAVLTPVLFAEVTIVDGQKWVCEDGICKMVEEEPSADTEDASESDLEDGIKIINGQKVLCINGECKILDDDSSENQEELADESFIFKPTRIGYGYKTADEFIEFIQAKEAVSNSFLAGKAWWLVILLVFVGGLAMNLTPCVLPMMPINLMIIGRSATRGMLYGLGIALAYGTLGVLASVGAMAFGEIQGSPWFNICIALLFFVLALAMLGVFFIDFSKKRNNLASMRTSMWPGFFAFFMGIVSAILAGACVAPILIAVLLLTADLVAKGMYFAFALPFVLGLGMAFPWPFAGAGMQVLPKPGAWMEKVNKVFGIIVLGFAAWYGYLAYQGFSSASKTEAEVGDYIKVDSPTKLDLSNYDKPIIVDCWATWCQSCAKMDKTFADDKVKNALKEKGYTLIKLQCEDIKELKRLPGCEKINGLPAYLVYE